VAAEFPDLKVQSEKVQFSWANVFRKEFRVPHDALSVFEAAQLANTFRLAASKKFLSFSGHNRRGNG